jgi:hypothetical protein
VEPTNVMDEVSLALEKGKTVLPVIHRECEIPFRLRRLQHVDLTLKYDEGLARLLEALGFAALSLRKNPRFQELIEKPLGQDLVQISPRETRQRVSSTRADS